MIVFGSIINTLLDIGEEEPTDDTSIDVYSQ